MSGPGERRAPWWPVAVVGGWAAAVAVGMAILIDFAVRPGAEGSAPALWPKDASVPFTPGRPALVMLAHPQCPCTRASLEELSRLLAQARADVAVYVLFLKPAGVPDDWWRTDTWRAAGALPGVTVIADEDGRQAALFGADTSGHTLLYDGAGRLRFSGGITPARGHEGDNAGRDAVLALLRGREPSRNESSVFGCGLSHAAAPSPPEVSP